jgi:hypothetical protein
MSDLDPILAMGATGVQAANMIALLAAAGYPLRPRDGEAEVTGITEEVMLKVREAQEALGIVEPGTIDVVFGEDKTTTIEGEFIGQLTWDGLRAAAAKATGLLTPAEAQVLVEAAATAAAPAAAGAAVADATAEPAANAPAAPEASSDMPLPADPSAAIAEPPNPGKQPAADADSWN